MKRERAEPDGTNMLGVDVATLMYENKRMMMKWTAFMDYVEDRTKRRMFLSAHMLSHCATFCLHFFMKVD